MKPSRPRVNTACGTVLHKNAVLTRMNICKRLW